MVNLSLSPREPIVRRVVGDDVTITYNARGEVEYEVPLQYKVPLTRRIDGIATLGGRDALVSARGAFELDDERPLRIEPLPVKTWTRPRPPSKQKGRRGTRRAWKLKNTPGWRDMGETRRGVQMFDRILWSAPALEAEFALADGPGRYMDHELLDYGGLLKLIVTLSRPRLVERFQRVVGSRLSSYLASDNHTVEVEHYCGSQEEAYRILRQSGY